MEYEQQENNKPGNFIDRMKESPRTVSAIIIVVIVIAAIYAFSGNNQTQNPVATTSSSPSVSPTPEVSPIPTTGTVAGGATVTPVAPVSQDTLMNISKTLPAGTTTDNAYVETAQKGDGLTHLARRAATRYLADHDAGYTVTNEHRIYIEDYIRKHIAKHPVAIGSQQTITFDLVKQAVDSASHLTDKQLHNLTKYTHPLTI